VTGEKHSIQEDQSTEKPNTNLKHKQRRQKTVSNEKENNEANSTKDSVVRDNRQYVLAGTGLQKGSADRMIRLASSLGGIVKTKLSTRVTHLITDCFKEGHAQRTMKYFHAILSGIWILDFAWIKECDKANLWVEEEPFEVQADTKFSGGPKKGRVRAQEGVV